MSAVSDRFAEVFTAVTTFVHNGTAYDVYRGGTGKPVILLHEIDGFRDPVKALALDFEGAGFEVHVPKFWGHERLPELPAALAGAGQICIRREFVGFATGKTSPVADWVRHLARTIAGDRKVGVVGMCLTGGVALAAVTQLEVAAAVAAQPAMPWAAWPFDAPERRSDLGLSDGDRTAVEGRLKSGATHVVPLRFTRDYDWRCPAARVDAIAAMTGADPVHPVDGKEHATLTFAHRPGARKKPHERAASQAAIQYVLGFLGQHL